MPLAVGLIYDLLGTLPKHPGQPADAEAEFEPEVTLEGLEAALARLGHRPIRIGNPHALLDRLGKGELPPLDAALNIAEGYGGRNREAWAPVLLEMAGVPTLGSDALTLSTTLDKHWTRERVAAAGVPVPRGWSVESAAEAKNIAEIGLWPLFVKPRWEGTAKGITPMSRVEGQAALVREVARVVETYDQPALVEAFVPGAEFTVTVVGHRPSRALPVLQRALEANTGIGIHALERFEVPAGEWRSTTLGSLDTQLEQRLATLACLAFETLECRDFARVDFRMAADGTPQFLEINPLPTFAPDGSFGILAELAGRSLEELLGEVFSEALARLGVTS